MLFALALLLAHVPSVQARAIAAVKGQLKDPDSARFRGLRIKADGSGCGWVNAKNTYGGYTGFGVFYINREGKVAIVPPELSEPVLCE